MLCGVAVCDLLAVKKANGKEAKGSIVSTAPAGNP
jgi:hypothetical protein